MMLRKPIHLIFGTICAVVFVTGCSDRKPSEEANPEPPKPEMSSPTSTPVLNSAAPQKMAPRNAGAAPSEKQEIMNLVAEVKNGPDTISAVASEWVKYWRPEFDKPWTSTTAGQALPQLLDALSAQQAPPFYQLLRGKTEPWATDPQQKKSAIALASICASAFSKSDAENPYPAAEFPDLFRPRENSLPVSVGDVLTYQIVDETSSFFESMPKLPNGQLGSWVEFSKAQNPIYRLMALKLFGKFNTTPQQAESFYSSYLSEGEPAINRAVVESLASRTDPWAVSLLPQIKAKLPASP